MRSIDWKFSMIGLAARSIILIFFLFSTFPIVWVILTSFKKPVEAYGIPPVLISIPPTLSNWIELFTNIKWGGALIFQSYLPNSLIAASVTTVFSIALSIPAAFSFSRHNFRGKKALGVSILAFRMIPPIALTIPLLIIYRQIGLYDNLLALIITYTALNSPIAVWMLKAFVDEIPPDLEEAAKVDGCTPLGSFLKITLPLIVPGLAAVAFFSYILAWNDFAVAFFLIGRKAKTLPIVAYGFFTEEGIEFGPMAAFTTIMIAPTIIISFFVAKRLIKGLTLGAIKG